VELSPQGIRAVSYIEESVGHLGDNNAVVQFLMAYDPQLTTNATLTNGVITPNSTVTVGASANLGISSNAGVYVFTEKNNPSKQYVGSAVNFSDRVGEHVDQITGSRTPTGFHNYAQPLGLSAFS